MVFPRSIIFLLGNVAVLLVRTSAKLRLNPVSERRMDDAKLPSRTDGVPHGGNVDWATAVFGEPSQGWLDLSTASIRTPTRFPQSRTVGGIDCQRHPKFESSAVRRPSIMTSQMQIVSLWCRAARPPFNGFRDFDRARKLRSSVRPMANTATYGNQPGTRWWTCQRWMPLKTTFRF